LVVVVTKSNMRGLAPSALALVLVLLASLAAGCGGGRVRDWQVGGLGSSLSEIQREARREGRLDLVIRPGYEERGRTDTFTEQTGCEVTTRNATSPDDLLDLISSGDYDGVLTTSDVTRRLIAGGDVAPVNFALVPGRRDVFDDLKGRAFDTVEGVGYAVPQGRAPNVEVFRTDFLPPDTQSLELIWNQALRGRISVYDDPMFIADAAVYLKATNPRLHITSPYALDQRQFAAVLRLLRREKRNVSNFWNAATAPGQIAAFASERAIIGITWPHQVTLMRDEDPPLPVAAAKPAEGTTGWVDEWLIAALADHPNCMYLWLDYVVSPEANAKVVELFSEAPANRRACDFTPSSSDCSDLHADDEEWWKDVSYWRAPEADCGDARGDVCKSYEDWRDAWLALRG
jgi:putative spermidine/putrescine transport system substrate-binding protein